MSEVEPRENREIEAASPALAACLSDLGRRVAFPPGIPHQAAQARGKAFNATIGQITDGLGSPVPFAPLDDALAGLSDEDRERALLYSPIDGVPEVRRRWRDWQRRHAPEAPSTLPLVTVGLTHGLSLLADLFGGPGRPVAVPEPFWGNYRHTFTVRTGAELLKAPAYRDGRFNPRAQAEALAGLPAGEPALAIVNLPSNPGGYSPTVEERVELVASLVEVAEQRPLLVICDDAYAGLVYEEEIPEASVFWDFNGRHPQLVPVKVDGATKELAFFGGRVGFLTFPFEEDSPVAAALASKVKTLTRATLGSPVATTQVVVAAALRDGRIGEAVAAVHQLLKRRYLALRDALGSVDLDLFRPLPFNSGCFALLELAEGLGVTAEEARQHLLAAEDTGVVAVDDRYLRIAFCSVAQDALPALVERLERGIGELAGAGPRG